ncbi:hypothetical protein PCASD_12194 [Puccinia coronata f. sp. avenae]|uniref:Uncharacterized protein n=1 Tax=Puccinia coronata f. sp. avenae TaxID=200324 RepID=A0A2N5UIT8_9BASI|nr:hypothetical protein PCASD_12194 [Puccinia coronata f. sp. avenae]
MFDGNFQPHCVSHPHDLDGTTGIHEDGLGQPYRNQPGQTSYPENRNNQKLAGSGFSNGQDHLDPSITPHVSTAPSVPPRNLDTLNYQPDPRHGSHHGTMRITRKDHALRPAPYTYPGRQTASTKLNQQSNSTGDVSECMQRIGSYLLSDVSTTSNILIWPYTLACIQEKVKAIIQNDRDPKEMLRLAQPLFQSMSNGPQPFISIQSPNLWSQKDTAEFSNSQGLKNFVRSHLQQILLRPDLNIFGRQNSRTPSSATSPLTLIKNHQDGFGTLINKAAKAQLAYLRLMIFRNQLQQTKNENKDTSTFWNKINQDLLHRCSKPALYKLAFFNLVTNQEKALWDGQRNSDSVTKAEVSLPTNSKVNTKMEAVLNAPNKHDIHTGEAATR